MDTTPNYGTKQFNAAEYAALAQERVAPYGATIEIVVSGEGDATTAVAVLTSTTPRHKDGSGEPFVAYVLPDERPYLPLNTTYPKSGNREESARYAYFTSAITDNHNTIGWALRHTLREAGVEYPFNVPYSVSQPPHEVAKAAAVALHAASEAAAAAKREARQAAA